MAKPKPLVVVTRKLPDIVETRMMELFDTRLNRDDKPLTQAELIETSKIIGMDAIVEAIASGRPAAAGRALADHVAASRERMHRARAPASPSSPARIGRTR